MNSNDRNKLIYKNIIQFINDIQTDKYRGSKEIYERVLKFEKSICRDVFNSSSPCWDIIFDFQKHESILYNLPEYRDHYIHQANVFLLGYYIINKIGIDKIEKILLSSLQDKGIAPEMKKIDVLKIWFFTSFFHDVAYAIQKTPALIDVFLRELLGGENKGKVREKKVVGDGNWGLTLDWNNNLYHFNEVQRYFYGDDKGKKRLINKVVHNALIDHQDHGVFGAIILLNRMGKEVEEDPVTFYTSGVSILLHNKLVWQNLKEKNIFEKIKFTEYPIAFLLMFCDNAQEWGRQIELEKMISLGQNPKIGKIFGKSANKMTEICCELEYIQKIPRIKALNEFIDEAPNYWSSGDEKFMFEIYFSGPTEKRAVRFGKGDFNAKK